MSGYPSDWDSRRRRVYKRDNYECQNCGKKGAKRGNAELHAHHIVPISKGGSHKESNLTTLCRECHSKVHPDLEKGDEIRGKYSGMPHTWPGPNWDSSKGISQGRQQERQVNNSDHRNSNPDNSTEEFVNEEPSDSSEAHGNQNTDSKLAPAFDVGSSESIVYNEHLEPTGTISKNLVSFRETSSDEDSESSSTVGNAQQEETGEKGINLTISEFIGILGTSFIGAFLVEAISQYFGIFDNAGSIFFVAYTIYQLYLACCLR